MRRHMLLKTLYAAALLSLATGAQSQNYGPPITLQQARKVYAAAEAEALKNKWPVAIVILDSGCNPVLMQRADNTQLAAPMVAQDKAWTACAYRRSTKVLQDALAKGGENWRYLQFRGMVAGDGGLPIIVGGQVIGAIGVSGVAGNQDAEVAKAGAAALQ